jgi:hypothetical protein
VDSPIDTNDRGDADERDGLNERGNQSWRENGEGLKNRGLIEELNLLGNSSEPLLCAQNRGESGIECRADGHRQTITS